LRRCRAIAEGIRTIDPDPRWRKMRKAAKELFKSLGELRDVQVLEAWVTQLAPPDDAAKDRLLAFFAQREGELKVHAGEALNGFDTGLWLRWGRALEMRVRKHPVNSVIFQVVALEKLEAATELQQIAMRTRSKASLHAVRIGLKRLRYVVENFLPEYDERWRGDLKQLQDVLGEVHDLDVLWATGLHIHSFTSPEERQRWKSAIAQERSQRVAVYKQKLAGRHSLLHQWRTELPEGEVLREAITTKFNTWASLLDPDPAHSRRVLETSLELYDRLLSFGLVRVVPLANIDSRELLKLAATTHEIGRANGKRGHRNRAARLLEKLDVPPGWTSEHLRLIGMIARYHCGALPFEEAAFTRMARAKQRLVALLGGILRLAEALDAARPDDSRRAALDRHDGFLVLNADGFSRPEKIAAACHLLESACNVPVLVRTSGELLQSPRQRFRR
jgi:CHAD domain-containing protein